VVANCDHLAKLKFSKTLPYAFTEHGAIQAADRPYPSPGETHCGGKSDQAAANDQDRGTFGSGSI
jgi:hypothetical protein